MYILQSILNEAKSFANINWQTETLPMPLRQVEKVLKARSSAGTGKRRYRMVKV